MARKPEIITYDYGRYFCLGYIFTNHFFESWRERIQDSGSDEKIVRQAVGRLQRSHLKQLVSRGKELREHDGLMFVVRRKKGLKYVITVMYTWDMHRILETDYYEQHQDVIDNKIAVGIL